MLSHFDRVIVLDDGAVVADGKWQDVVVLDAVSSVVQKVRQEST